MTQKDDIQQNVDFRKVNIPVVLVISVLIPILSAMVGHLYAKTSSNAKAIQTNQIAIAQMLTSLEYTQEKITDHMKEDCIKDCADVKNAISD